MVCFIFRENLEEKKTEKGSESTGYPRFLYVSLRRNHVKVRQMQCRPEQNKLAAMDLPAVQSQPERASESYTSCQIYLQQQ